MPNWCENTLFVYGPVAEVKRFIKKAEGHGWNWDPLFRPDEDASPLSFHQLVPMPADVIAKGYNDAGYAWENDNWGVKWGACGDVKRKRLVLSCDKKNATVEYRFDTPWGPAETFFTRVGPIFPELTFTCEYREEGMEIEGTFTVHGEAVSNE